MDLLHTYPNFSNDITKAFHGLIDEFHLELLNPSEGLYLLKGDNCKLRFTFDRGDISCQIKQSGDMDDGAGHVVYLVYRHLFPYEANSENKDRVYDFLFQLQYDAQIVEKYLKPVMNGDFSWLPSFLAEEDYENKLIWYVISNLHNDNPIQRKFWACDVSWKIDLESYLKERNIKL